MGFLDNPWVSNILSGLATSLVLFVVGFLIGKHRERRRQKGKNLDEYDFYPYGASRENFAEFNRRDFRLGIHYFLRNTDPTAARQLIFIGEQNNVRAQLEPEERREYERLFAKYHGAAITEDARDYLENYRNLVRLIGRTFPNMGIEVLLHDLSNPSRSITAIESGEVTGRTLEMGTTTLLIDLKKRRAAGQDKLNYELNIGARRFKCTTIPILRKEYGVVGAICINIDVNVIRDEVLKSAERVEEFFRNYSRTDMKLEENILSKDEYQKAVKGKRHYHDTSY